MNIEPIKKYNIPKYPEKSVIIHNPAMLKAIPERWKDNISIGVALSSIIALTLTGCGSSQAGTNGTSTENGNSSNTVSSIQAAVAPIFEHGGGRGSFGCVSVVAPSFLSEQEALQVIQEEAIKYGVTFEAVKSGEGFKKGIHELESVDIPETKLYFDVQNDSEVLKKYGTIINSTKKGNLTLDGYATDKKIGFEFVSIDDYEKWSGNQKGLSIVELYDVKNTAKLLQKGISNKNGDSNIGVFYDPMPLDEVINSASEKAKKEGKTIEMSDYHELRVKAIEMADEQLRLQVRDFLEWLKAQGVI